MKYLFALFFTISSFYLRGQIGLNSIDVQHYMYEIYLSDSTDLIKGRATITFKVLSPASAIKLDLVKVSGEKGMSVQTVTDKQGALKYVHQGKTLEINFNRQLAAGEQKEITIAYSGIPNDGLIISKNKYNRRTFFSDNWPNRASNWIPCIDHPADKASVEFVVNAPSHYQVISNGIQVEETNVHNNRKITHYKETTELPTKIMVIGVAEFAVQYAGDVRGIPVYSWVYPEEKDKGFYDYAQAVEILPFFIDKVGPYAYKKLANVQSKTIFGGMENAGAIFYAETSITGKRTTEALIAHEIAHQWFGNMATESHWPHIWLSEGFATYLAALYLENKYGADTLKKVLIKNREQVIAYAKKKLTAVVDTSVTNYMELLNANSYEKGGWILHMLRMQLGDSLFWKGIRNYYSTYAGKNASTTDLRKILEDVSGKNLESFFYRWLYTAGHPVLSIEWKYDLSKKLLNITVVQKQQQLFEFPLEISIEGGEKDVLLKRFDIKGKQTSFSVSMNNKPTRVVIDPDVQLLYEGSVKEIR